MTNDQGKDSRYLSHLAMTNSTNICRQATEVEPRVRASTSKRPFNGKSPRIANSEFVPGPQSSRGAWWPRVVAFQIFRTNVSIFSPHRRPVASSVFSSRPRSHDSEIINDFARVSRSTLENRPWSVPLCAFLRAEITTGRLIIVRREEGLAGAGRSRHYRASFTYRNGR